VTSGNGSWKLGQGRLGRTWQVIGAGGEIISDVIRQARGHGEMWPVTGGGRQRKQGVCVCVSWRRARPANGFVSQRRKAEAATWRAANRRLGTSRARSGGDRAHGRIRVGRWANRAPSAMCHRQRLLASTCSREAATWLARPCSDAAPRLEDARRCLGAGAARARAPPTRNRDVTVTMD
jgi:hypothetical protein